VEAASSCDIPFASSGVTTQAPNRIRAAKPFFSRFASVSATRPRPKATNATTEIIQMGVPCPAIQR
jgi:hypothetical protein